MSERCDQSPTCAVSGRIAGERIEDLETENIRLAATVERVRGLLGEWEISSSRPIASAALDWQSRHAAELRAAIEGTDS